MICGHCQATMYRERLGRKRVWWKCLCGERIDSVIKRNRNQAAQPIPMTDLWDKIKRMCRRQIKFETQ